VGAAVGIFLLPVLVKAWGLGVTTTLLAAASIAAPIVTRVFGVETRGRSLEALDNLEG
jgi:hypothetical protein